jgi:arylsulfatase A-like enzyme
MKENATKSVPLAGAFWDAGAQVFINKGVNGRWCDTLTPKEAADYETRVESELGSECARWLATGKWIGQKSSFLEGGIRVPAIVSYPNKLPAGVVRDQIVTAMDWYPTVLELCGVEPKRDAPEIDGHSLLPIIDSNDAKSGYSDVLHFAWGNRWAVRDGDWKLLGASTNNKMQLHRLDGDQPERIDHAKENPEVVARLKELHKAWAKDVKPK